MLFRSIAKISSDIEYTIHFNPPTKEIPPEQIPLFGSKTLTPGHWGCFNAFKKAIVEDFTDDYDFLIVCERDCFLEKSPEDIVDLLEKTYEVMNQEDVLYFSFGDKSDLDHGYLQSDTIKSIKDFAFLTDKIIGLQFIIISKNGRNFLREKFISVGWHGMDIWLNVIFSSENKLMGILNERATTQLDGMSLIDNEIKTFTKLIK